MYAVIKAGAHQYRVTEGETLLIDQLVGQPGDRVSFDVLMLGGDQAISLGQDLKNAKVEAVIKKQTRAPKVLVFKYKRRKNHKKTQGHRQNHTLVSIDKIVG